MMTDLPAVIEKTNDNIITTEDADWLDHLREQVLAVVIEYGCIIRDSYISLYWDMGKHIMQEIERQTKLYEDDQVLPPDQQTRDPPASRNYIFQELEPSLVHYEGFIGTGRTALYAATAFYIRCPTEEIRDEMLDELAKRLGKSLAWRDVCQILLPGHQTQRIAPTTLYHGAAKYSGKAQGLGYITFEASDSLDIKPGTPIRVKITTL